MMNRVRSPLQTLSDNQTYPSPKSKSQDLLKGYTNSPAIKPSRRSTYNVTFPIGSMGLELEPVIISSESRIGCRVRGYYFAADHKGIARADLETNVSIGDIITTIEGQSMISMTFEEIIVLLGESRNKIRTIGFNSSDINSSNTNNNNNTNSSSNNGNNNNKVILKSQ